MKRLRSLNLCDSGIDQTTCQLNEVAHMYADRQVYRKLQEFPVYFMGVFRPKAFEIQCFQRHFWQQQLQVIFQQSTCMLDLSSLLFSLKTLGFKFVLQGSLINQLPLPSCAMLELNHSFLHIPFCTKDVLHFLSSQNIWRSKQIWYQRFNELDWFGRGHSRKQYVCIFDWFNTLFIVFSSVASDHL